MKNILYIGMYTDIILPFLIEPDFDNLYVINDVDIAYGTWKQQINDILSILENGSDKYLEKDEIHPISGRPCYKIRNYIARLPHGHCEILSSNTEEAKEFDLYKYKEKHFPLNASGKSPTFSWFRTKDETKCWKVEFLYGGKIRNLTYYLRDFYEIWPKEINHIDSLIWGSFKWDFFVSEHINKKYNVQQFIENIEERCNLPLNIHSNRDSFPEFTNVNTSKYIKERKICKLILKNFENEWWKKNLFYEEEPILFSS